MRKILVLAAAGPDVIGALISSVVGNVHFVVMETVFRCLGSCAIPTVLGLRLAW